MWTATANAVDRLSAVNRPPRVLIYVTKTIEKKRWLVYRRSNECTGQRASWIDSRAASNSERSITICWWQCVQHNASLYRFFILFLYHFLSLSRYSDAVQAKLNIDVFVLHNYSNSVWYFVLLFMSCRRPLLPSLERLLSFYAVCVEKYVTACLSLFHEILMINVNFLWHVYSLPFKFLMRRKNLWVTGFRLYLKNFASLKFLLDFPKHFVVFSLFFKLHWKSYLYLICYAAVFLLLVFVNTI